MKYLKNLFLNESIVTKKLVDEIISLPRWDSFALYIKLIPVTEEYEIAIKEELVDSFSKGRENWGDEEDLPDDIILIATVWETIYDNSTVGNSFGEVRVTPDWVSEFGDTWINDSNGAFIPNLPDEEYLEEIIIRLDPHIEEVINSGTIQSAVNKGIVIDYELLVPIILEFYPPMEKTYREYPPDQVRMDKLTRAARLLANKRI